jgi:hypothetical protein
MDDFRRKIVVFFNEKWLKSNKRKTSINVTNGLNSLILEYERVFNIRLSEGQILDFLVTNELKRIESFENYAGQYHRSNTVKLKQKLIEVKYGN